MLNRTYQKGLHLIVDLDHCKDCARSMDSFRQGILMQVEELGLHRLGEVFHEFPNRAFTAVICLTESHISVHTWPEFQRVTFDVFLSNFEHVNDDKAASLAHWIKMFFDGEIAQRKEVYR